MISNDYSDDFANIKDITTLCEVRGGERVMVKFCVLGGKDRDRQMERGVLILRDIVTPSRTRIISFQQKG